MSSTDRSLSAQEGSPIRLKHPDYKIGIVVSEYNSNITFSLRDAAIATLVNNGIQEKNILVEYAPGAYEMPMAAQWVSDHFKPEAVICLGCVVKGDTEHDVYINQAVASELMKLNTRKNRPFVFGLLTTNTMQQAIDRAGGIHGNKGEECAIAALKMLALHERLIDWEKSNSKK